MQYKLVSCQILNIHYLSAYEHINKGQFNEVKLTH
jgi:hypothetical protein